MMTAKARRLEWLGAAYLRARGSSLRLSRARHTRVDDRPSGRTSSRRLSALRLRWQGFLALRAGTTRRHPRSNGALYQGPPALPSRAWSESSGGIRAMHRCRSPSAREIRDPRLQWQSFGAAPTVHAGHRAIRCTGAAIQPDDSPATPPMRAARALTSADHRPGTTGSSRNDGGSRGGASAPLTPSSPAGGDCLLPWVAALTVRMPALEPRPQPRPRPTPNCQQPARHVDSRPRLCAQVDSCVRVCESLCVACVV